MNRRGFLRSTAILGSGLLAAVRASAQTAPTPAADAELNVALLGLGAQGQNLLTQLVTIPGVRIKAVCDIWEAYNLKEAVEALQAASIEHQAYTDYRQMLEKEKDLHAVIIATPDHCHAEQAAACLKAGLHVYCETPMAHTIEAARQMVAAARESGKHLQIGNQRRSNPIYRHCCNSLLREVNLLGRIMAVNSQWNRSVQPDRGWPRRFAMEDAALAQHGYASMQQFRNWRWYRELSGGPLFECGAHQVDVLNWFVGAAPRAVAAMGGTDHYDPKTHENFDTVLAVYEYETQQKPVRASYQVVTTNGNLGHYEKFLGVEGTMLLSEANNLGDVFREDGAPDWDKWIGLELLTREKAEGESESMSVVKSIMPSRYGLPVKMEEPAHKPHLANFFDAIRGKGTLNCPAEVAFPSLVAVAKAAEAVRTGRKAECKPEDFQA